MSNIITHPVTVLAVGIVAACPVTAVLAYYGCTGLWPWLPLGTGILSAAIVAIAVRVPNPFRKQSPKLNSAILS